MEVPVRIEALVSLANGQMFFSHEILEEGEWFIFDCRKTVGVLTNQTAAGGMEVGFIRLDETMMKPSHVRIPRTAVLSVSNITDSEMLMQIDASLSKIMLAKGFQARK